MILVTAGHVDHGKSTLIRALTGTGPDRLAEEQRRGLTIELGFAWTELPQSGPVSFIDVPGHRDFIRTMIAGVAAVGGALLVVDAREGWRAQTHEHVLILELAGVQQVVVAVTKAAVADEAQLAATLASTRENLAETPFATAGVVACDALAGTGLDELLVALDHLVSTAAAPQARLGPRLWVDRAFTVPGTGTVVTGSLAGGELKNGDTLEMISRDGSHQTRVRNLQSMARDRTCLTPGVRAAVNLAGVHHRSVHRGDALVFPGRWHLTQTIDVALKVAPSLGHHVTRRGAYTIHVGTAAESVRIRLIGADRLAPGADGAARVHLDRQLPLVPGDRFVLLEMGRAEVTGGGEILDVDPQLPPSKAAPDRSVDRVIRERGWVDADELVRLTGEWRSPSLGRWIIDPKLRSDMEAALMERLASADEHGVALADLDERQQAILENMAAQGLVDLANGVARLPGMRGERNGHPALDALRASPFAPPEPSALGANSRQLATWRRDSLIVSIDGITFPAEAPHLALQRIEDRLPSSPPGITVSEVAALLETSRKYALPLLGYLDRAGITRRVDGRRIAGPRFTTAQAIGSPIQAGRLSPPSAPA